MQVSLERPPLALIACSDDWMSRALENIFQQRGYVVAHTRSGAQSLELARLANHDLLVVDESLADLSALEVCRTIRDNARFDHSIPIVITSPTPPHPTARMTAFNAGAWEYCSLPVDVESVFVKLETFLRARGEITIARSEDFVNATTGLYTSFGLRQLAGKLGSRALRNHEAFACVAFAPQVQDREIGSSMLWKESASGFADVAHVLREQSRQSDVVGHVGEMRLAILAPDTDAAGARLLVARLQRELDRATQNKTIAGQVRLRAGYSAVADLATAKINVPELVHRAENALDHAPIQGDGDAIISFDDLPVF
ncbi:MAG TPA: response regulator [Gemmatimonadaceae bacterium]|jgi:DNA-binding response OmpR family regulator|nr:response regulator [Gemmatimonadaceae bacterium]